MRLLAEVRLSPAAVLTLHRCICVVESSQYKTTIKNVSILIRPHQYQTVSEIFNICGVCL